LELGKAPQMADVLPVAEAASGQGSPAVLACMPLIGRDAHLVQGWAAALALAAPGRLALAAAVRQTDD
jgi:hypothetical protein